MNEAKQVTVIQTTLTRRGDGKSNTSPVRIVTQWWDLEGNLLVESDPCARTIPPELVPWLDAAVLRHRLSDGKQPFTQAMEEHDHPAGI